MDRDELNDCLEKASRVFDLALKLGRAFEQEIGGGGNSCGEEGFPKVRYKSLIDDYITAVVDCRDVIANPSTELATVVTHLREAGHYAKQIREANHNESFGLWALFPELNSLAENGYYAVKEVRQEKKLDDPLAFLDDGFTDRKVVTNSPSTSKLSVVEDCIFPLADHLVTVVNDWEVTYSEPIKGWAVTSEQLEQSFIKYHVAEVVDYLKFHKSISFASDFRSQLDEAAAGLANSESIASSLFQGRDYLTQEIVIIPLALEQLIKYLSILDAYQVSEERYSLPPDCQEIDKAIEFYLDAKEKVKDLGRSLRSIGSFLKNSNSGHFIDITIENNLAEQPSKVVTNDIWKKTKESAVLKWLQGHSIQVSAEKMNFSSALESNAPSPRGDVIKASGSSPLTQYINVLVVVSEKLERCLNRDKQALAILSAEPALHEAIARADRWYWDRQRERSVGELVLTSRIWTRRDEKRLYWQQNYNGCVPSCRASRYISWLEPRSGASLHDSWFRKAINEARQDGTASALSSKLDDARSLFERMMQAARRITQDDDEWREFNESKLELGSLACELMKWAKEPEENPDNPKSAKEPSANTVTRLASIEKDDQFTDWPYEVDEKQCLIRIDGSAESVAPEVARMAKLLLDNIDNWVSMSKHNFTKPSEVKSKLPKSILDLLETEKGKGYRLKRAV